MTSVTNEILEVYCDHSGSTEPVTPVLIFACGQLDVEEMGLGDLHKATVHSEEVVWAEDWGLHLSPGHCWIQGVTTGEEELFYGLELQVSSEKCVLAVLCSLKLVPYRDTHC